MPANGSVSGVVNSPTFTILQNGKTTYHVGSNLKFTGSWGSQGFTGYGYVSTVEIGKATAYFHNDVNDFFTVEFSLLANSGHSRTVDNGTFRNLDAEDNFGLYRLTRLQIDTNNTYIGDTGNSRSSTAILNPTANGIYGSFDSTGGLASSLSEGQTYDFIVKRAFVLGGSETLTYRISGITQDDILEPLTGSLSLTNALGTLRLTPIADSKVENENVRIEFFDSAGASVLSRQWALTDVNAPPPA